MEPRGPAGMQRHPTVADGAVPKSVLALVEKAYALAFSVSEFDGFTEAWNTYVAETPEPDHSHDGSLTRNLEQAIGIIERKLYESHADLSPSELVALEPGPAAIIDRHLTPLVSNERWLAHHATPRHAAEFVHALRRVILQACAGLDPGPLFMATRQPAPELVSVLRMTSPDHEPLALVRLMRVEWSPAQDRLLTECFGLSQKEVATARLLTTDDSLADIAARRRRSEETIRTQAKSVYRKLHVSGRRGLAQFCMQLLILVERTQARGRRSVTISADDPERRYVATSRGDVSYVVRGAPDGRALVFLHGMASGHAFLPAFERGLVEAGIRLICIERPGYGHSAPADSWQNAVDHFVDAFGDVADHLCCGTLPVVSHTSGVLYAVAAAARTDRINRILATAGGVPLTSRALLFRYPARVRAVALASQRMPAVLRLLVAAGVRDMRRDRGARFLAGPYLGRLADREAMEQAQVASLLRGGYDLADCHGFDGFCGDAHHIFGDWSDHFDGLQVPMTYLNGSDDALCPALWARDFAATRRGIGVAVLAGAGQLMQHSHWPAYLAALTAFADDRPLEHPQIEHVLAAR